MDGGPAVDAGPAADGGPRFDAGSLNCPAPASATTVFAGDAVVATDADVTALAGFQRIEGRLTVFGGTYTSLAFPDLLEVTGSVLVDDAGDGGPLIDPGFPCLQVVGGRVDVRGDAWTTPSFPGLITTGDDVQLDPGVTSASFPRLDSILDLELHGTFLTDLSGFPSLRVLADDINFTDNTELTSLGALDLVSVGGRIDLRNNAVLADLDGVSSLVPGEGRIAVTDNPLLPACAVEVWRDRLALTHGARDLLQVRNNDDTARCPTLDASPCRPVAVPEDQACTGNEGDLLVLADGTLPPTATCLGSVTINAGAVDVCAPALVQVSGNLTVDATGLRTLRLPALRRVTGVITIRTDGLEVLDLRRLRSAASLIIYASGEPPPLDIYFPSLEQTNQLEVSDVGGTLLYFPSLNSVAGNLRLVQNPGPLDMWFPDISAVNGSFTVQENGALTSVLGLQRLDSVGGDLLFAYNPKLESLLQLDELASVGGFFDIHYNDRLVVVPPADMSVAGYAQIHDCPCIDDATALVWAQAVSPQGTATANGGGIDCPAP